MIRHRGGCHCGRVRFELLAPAVLNVSECNCSICSRSGHLGVIIPRARFTLVSGENSLLEYRFDSGEAKHLFCRHCGIKSFYIPPASTISFASVKLSASAVIKCHCSLPPVFRF